MALSIGGYDHSFVYSLQDRFICRICHLPSREPYLTDCCGATLCKSCLKEFTRHATTASISCPTCRQEHFGSMINKQIDREIRSLHIYCTNKEKGCEWQGELNDISNHLRNSDGCQFEELKCSNDCGKMIQRQYLTSHVETECPCREVNCQYCHDTGELQFIEGQHKEECPKLPLPCPNKCEVGSILREDMEAHRKECPLEMIKCEYHSVGCKRVILVHEDFEKHYNESMKEHLMLTKNKLADITVQLDAAMKQINSLTAVVNKLSTELYPLQLDARGTKVNTVCPATIKMTKYEDLNEYKKRWYSDPFYTHNKGYKMCLRVSATADYGNSTCKGTHLSVFLYLMKGPHDDELTWPLLGKKFEIKLLNQISDSEHHSRTLTYDNTIQAIYANRVTEHDKSKLGRGWHEYISNEDLNKITQTRQYLKDDCLFFRITNLSGYMCTFSDSMFNY